MQTIRTSLGRLSTAVRTSPPMYRVRSLTRAAFSDKYLLYTNVGISITLSGLGDYIEQRYEIYTKDLESWNTSRTQHMAFSGMGVGFICHFWYKFLDRRFPGRTFGIVMKKMLLDQVICSPLMISCFFISVALFEQIGYEELKREVKNKFMTLYKAEWLVWPPAQIINFYLLPTKYRVLYDNTISLGYDIFMSRVRHSKEYDQPAKTPDKVVLEAKSQSVKPQLLTVS